MEHVAAEPYLRFDSTLWNDVLNRMLVRLVWDYAETFFANMSRSVLQSNWYYGVDFTESRPASAYREPEAYAYDQLPTGSNWSSVENLGRTVIFARQHISSQRLYGFLQTVWKPTLEVCRERHMDALEILRPARELCQSV